MPIYEYQCNNCEHKFEEMQRMSDDRLTVCPECGEAALRKLISAAVFRLKGEGWYETDFKDSGKKKKKDEAKGKDGDGKKTDTAETKSEAKSDKSGGTGESKSSGDSSTKSSSSKKED